MSRTRPAGHERGSARRVVAIGAWMVGGVAVAAAVAALLTANGGDGQTLPPSPPPSPPAGSAEQPPPPDPVVLGAASLDHGFSPGYSILWDDDELFERDLDGMAAAGAGWVRVDFDWSVVERQKGAFDWRPIDRAVDAVHERDMRVLALPTYTPGWARPEGSTDKHAPLDPADFAHFVGLAVERYSPRGVTHWEIWNEANYRSFWQPLPDPVAYAELLRLASAAARAADSDAFVLTSGTGPAMDTADGATVSPETFLETLYEAGVADSFDAVAHHPYSYPERPTDPRPHGFVTTTLALRSLMQQHGDAGKQIWGTEFGAPVGTSDRAVTPEDQGAHLREAYDRWFAWDFTGPLLWYNWRDTGTDADDAEQNFGLVRADHSPKPALEAFRQHVEDRCTAPAARCRR